MGCTEGCSGSAEGIVSAIGRTPRITVVVRDNFHAAAADTTSGQQLDTVQRAKANRHLPVVFFGGRAGNAEMGVLPVRTRVSFEFRCP